MLMVIMRNRMASNTSNLHDVLPVLAAVEPALREWVGQANCPSLHGGGDIYPLFPGENRESVAVAIHWDSRVKCGITKSVERLPWRQDPHIPRERTRRRRHLQGHGQSRAGR